MVIIMVRVMSRTLARMVTVRSSATWSLMLGGMDACSAGSCFSMLSNVWRTLAPGDEKTMIRMDGRPLNMPKV